MTGDGPLPMPLKAVAHVWHSGLLWREEDTMEPTLPGTDFRLPRHHHYPSMTGEERLEALRSIRGMWKGKGQEIMQLH
jgi:hypothetical protein